MMFPLSIPTVGYSALDMSQRGLRFDAYFKRFMSAYSDVTVPEERDSPYDILIGEDRFHDLKLVTDKGEARETDYAYLSHNEYLFAKDQENFFYIVYRERADVGEARLACVFSFQYAKDAGAIELFDSGKKVFCKATGKHETPWSINITRVQQFLKNDVDKGVILQDPWYNESLSELSNHTTEREMGQPQTPTFVTEAGAPAIMASVMPQSGISWVNDIAEMHDKFGVNPVIRTLDKDKLRDFLQFRIDFLQEELDELDLALNDPDFEKDRADESVDALIDLCVVAIGTLNAFDVNSDEAWRRVHEKNMQKNAGINASRPNPLGLPDLIKPEGWTPPTHIDNVGLFSKVFND